MLALPPEFMLPDYTGRGLVNAAATLCHAFGAPCATPPLAPDLLGDLLADVRRIVVVLVDALGHDALAATLAENPDNGFHRALAGGRLRELTSVCPSTTTAALTSLWTAASPAEHGLLGHRLWLREFGLRADMIRFAPVGLEHLGRDALMAAGLQPEQFLAVPSVAQRLATVDVPVYNLLARQFLGSGLSRVQVRGQRASRGFVTSTDLWILLREWLAEVTDERAVFVAYWHCADDLQHVYGPASPTLAAEVNNLGYSFEREFLRPLGRQAARGTLFLLLSDHGQVAAPAAEMVRLLDHPELLQRLAMAPTGDSRASYLTCRQGEVGAVLDYCRTHLAAESVVCESQAALAAGLFGPGEPAPEARHRLGDVLYLSRGSHLLWDRAEPPTTLGRHGGLSRAEMSVPLLAARLDA